MDARPAPPVTIEGGPGWQLADAGPGGAPDVVGEEPVERPTLGDRLRTPSRPRSAAALALALALGVVLGLQVADARLQTLVESDAGTLSLEPVPDGADGEVGLVDGPQGPSLTLTVALRNTGPRPVALQSARLLGTRIATEPLDGRRVADGGRTALRLLSPVDCDDLVVQRLPGPLEVTATTDAGERTTRVRLATFVLQHVDDYARSTCGAGPPAQSAVAGEEPLELRGDGTAVLGLRLAALSREPLQVQSLRGLAGLRVREVLAAGGRPLAVPFTLPAGDYSEPREPFEGSGDEVLIGVVVEAADCAVTVGLSPDTYAPALEVGVADAQGRRPATMHVGSGGDVLRMLCGRG